MENQRQLNSIIQQALILNQARNTQEKHKTETKAHRVLRMMGTNPDEILYNKENYREALETVLWIQDKNREIRRLKLNRSQEILLDAYFEMKEDTPAIRINILKGRQQGMSTAIGAMATLELLCHPNTRALIASEEKGGSGENIFMMYITYLTYFQQLIEDELTEQERKEWFWEGTFNKRFSFGDVCELPNRSTFNVVGEKLVTSRTLQFIHLSEAAFFNHLEDCMGMLNQTIPKTTESFLAVESTAKEYGNAHYDLWIGGCAGRSAFKPLFLPWFVHDEYQIPFRSEEERIKFERTLGESDEDEFGNERELLTLDVTKSDWFKAWNCFSEEDFKYVTLENLKWRRVVIQELNGVIPEFNRQYPTLPEMAFLSNTSHVLDMNAIRWYMNYKDEETGETMIKEQERGQLVERVDGSSIAEYKQMRGGILHVWEHPNPHYEYLIGVDVAEGRDGGDFSCAYVISRLPFRVVCKLRGYDGRRINIKEFSRQLYLLGKYYNNAYICPENNAEGSSVPAYLLEWSYPNLVPEAILTNQPTDRFGWRNTHGMRERGIAELQEVIHSRHIGIPDAMFMDEAHHFVYVNGRAQAARKGQSSGAGISVPGSHDDCIFALIGALLANTALPRAKTEDEIKHVILVEQNRRRDRKNKQLLDNGGADWMSLV